ncbi:MAG TPA: VOC family protein [Nocardioidaceae bacterium]|nr:VOC family protein [Nocardioidaceae bacterium]
MSGEIVHFEIPADDTERAYAFYRDAFGWQIQPMPELDYAFVTTTPVDDNGRPSEPGMINGGMFQRNKDLPSPVVTVNVDDIDAALARVAELGGSPVGEKAAVADMGWAAYFIDPEGNVMGLWQTAR